MRKSSIGHLVSVVLVMAAAASCSDSGGGGTGKGGGAGTSSSGGRGGTTGTGGRGGTTGTGGGTAGTGGGTAGTGGGTAGTGGGTAGTGGGTAGTGGGTAGTGGTTGTAGNGGRGGGGGTGGSAGATGGATAGSGGSAGATGGATAGSGGSAGATGGATAGSGGSAGATGGATAGSGGSAGTGGSGTPAPNPPITGTATRPQLTAGTDYTILKYFEKAGSLVTGLTTDNWDPTAGVGDVSSFTATYTVATSGGTHTSVQAALNAAVTAGGTARVYIKVEPGMYRETICHKSSTPPITLYSTNADASQTVIVSAGYAGKVYTNPPPTDPPWNPCASSNPPATDAIYGTSGSATVGIFAPNFQMKNLTIANDYVEVGTSNIQAVALMAQNDKLIFENVRLLGNQDTLYVKTGNPDTVQRAYFKSCYVEGDVDFIFGRATFVLDGCEIKYLGARRGATNGGDIISPSTDFRNAYGLLVIGGTFTSDGVPNAGTVSLGRAWDEGQSASTYPLPGNATGNTGGYPSGQAVVLGSTLGAHLMVATPWAAAASTSRAYSSVPTVNTSGATIPANRLWEFQNTGPGAAP